VKDKQGKLINIIDYELPDDTSCYLVLESISTSVNKVVHVVDMRQIENFFIGRGTEADVRVTDISVSRLHASIFKTKTGQFYICDNNSKFGTMLQVRTPMKISKKTALQAGRSVLHLNPVSSCTPAARCPCGKQKEDKAIEGELVTLNGVDYFPAQFCSSDWLNQRRKLPRKS
jgi:hypothetical protein